TSLTRTSPVSSSPGTCLRSDVVFGRKRARLPPVQDGDHVLAHLVAGGGAIPELVEQAIIVGVGVADVSDHCQTHSLSVEIPGGCATTPPRPPAEWSISERGASARYCHSARIRGCPGRRRPGRAPHHPPYGASAHRSNRRRIRCTSHRGAL